MTRCHLQILAVLLLEALCSKAFSQSAAADYYGPYRFEAKSRQRVFSDTAFVRNAAASSAGLADTLFAFEEITVLDTAGVLLTVGRKNAPWYRIRYAKNGVSKTGFLWGGALAIYTVTHGGAAFACGLLSYPIAGISLKGEDEDLPRQSTFSIKAKSGSAVQECRYSISRESGFFLEKTDTNGNVTDTHILPAGDLPEGTKFLVQFRMSGEACGIPTYHITAAWDGARLVRMPLLQSNADGAEWSYEEAFVFPKDKGGKPGVLLIKGTAESSDERTEKRKQEIRWRSFSWDAAAWRFK